jgi:hypothetical protein
MINKKLAQQASRCLEDFRAMTSSIQKTAESLRARFAAEVALTAGRTLPLLGSNALDEKFSVDLRRAEQSLLKELDHGHKHADYPSFLHSLPPAHGQDTNNRVTVRAWNAAKGSFLEVLCLLADLSKRSSSPAAPVPLRLFAPTGPIEVFKGDQQQFIWAQKKLKAKLSGMDAIPDILITTKRKVSAETIVAIRECKCHRRLAFDEIRKECGKARDLIVSSYVIVSYYTVSDKKRRGAEGLGLKVEEVGLDSAEREEYVSGKKNMAFDLARKLENDDEEGLFRSRMKDAGAFAREKEERGR